MPDGTFKWEFLRCFIIKYCVEAARGCLSVPKFGVFRAAIFIHYFIEVAADILDVVAYEVACSSVLEKGYGTFGVPTQG